MKQRDPSKKFWEVNITQTFSRTSLRKLIQLMYSCIHSTNTGHMFTLSQIWGWRWGHRKGVQSLYPDGIHSPVLETEKKRTVPGNGFPMGRWATWPGASSVNDRAPAPKQKGLTLKQTALELF